MLIVTCPDSPTGLAITAIEIPVDIDTTARVVVHDQLEGGSGLLTIIESGSRAWALAAADGDLHVYSRDDAAEWSEV